jgi:hypothetical protein
MSEPVYILLKIYPSGEVEAMPVADNEQEFLKALAAWRELCAPMLQSNTSTQRSSKKRGLVRRR